jgi:hypothetical protein
MTSDIDNMMIFGGLISGVKVNASDGGDVTVVIKVPQLFAHKALVLGEKVGDYCESIAFGNFLKPSKDVKVKRNSNA